MAIAVSSLVISIVIAIIYFWREKTALTEAALEREQRRAAEIERVALAANLRALQAQIEPHFLFNTLANVQHLVEVDPPSASRMLESLIQYLRAALPQADAQEFRRKARQVEVEQGVQLRADATLAGSGGTVVVWSDDNGLDGSVR